MVESPQPVSGPTLRLSKSRYLAGLQCSKLLWWTVHEPKAPELVADGGQQAVLDRGHRVGDLARTYVPGGVLIDFPYSEIDRRVAETAKAIRDGAPAIYEAAFLADGVFVAVDILERHRDGFIVVEVKSTLDVKDTHIADVAVQTHVVRRAGLTVKRAEVMHLNRECRHPDLSNLFVRKRVTSLIRSALRAVPTMAPRMLTSLGGGVPEVATGTHCNDPYPCPFTARCWPPVPANHVSNLYRIRAATAEKLVADGYQTLIDLPRRLVPAGPARRQVRSARSGEIVVERGLRRALARLKTPIAYLDFETVSPAVPVWPGCRPYEQVPVQFSCEVMMPGGRRQHAWLAEGAGDPRPGLARALIAACKGAETVLAYNAPFERRCVEGLAEALPEMKRELVAISRRLRDLLPMVRDYVYDPGFGGSFSIKDVVPALVPEFGYDDLPIQDGGTASAALETLLLEPEALTPAERRSLRRDLLRYCDRDTLAMVRLHERLVELAREA